MIIKYFSSPAKIIFSLVVVFLSAQAFTGKQGLLSWREYSREADKLASKKQELELKRQNLERRVQNLKANKPDADLIEEIAIEKLDLSKPNDIKLDLK